MKSALDVVNGFYEVSLQQKDADGVRSFLTDDFEFVGPMAHVKGADAFVELNRQFLPAMRASRMVRQFEQGDEVCSIYELDLVGPSGAQFTADMADWIRVTGGRMAEQRLYYDAREFEKQMSGG